MPTPRKSKPSSASVAKIGRPRLFLLEWRKFKDLSQEQLAERLGTTKQTISKQELGQREVTMGHLTEIAAEYGVRPQDLFSPPERWAAESALDRLTPEQQQRIISLVEALKPTGTSG